MKFNSVVVPEKDTEREEVGDFLDLFIRAGLGLLIWSVVWLVVLATLTFWKCGYIFMVSALSCGL